MEQKKYKKSALTRAKLMNVAHQMIEQDGYAALRVEEITKSAGVSKGTFFKHFRDKDALMDLIIGAALKAKLDHMGAQPAPESLEDMIARLIELVNFMSCERYVFDVIMRHSGAAAIEEIGPIAETFGQQIVVFSAWLDTDMIRKDVATHVLAEGIQAFLMQVLALKFCALHPDKDMPKQLHNYLSAWLLPQQADTEWRPHSLTI